MRRRPEEGTVGAYSVSRRKAGGKVHGKFRRMITGERADGEG